MQNLFNPHPYSTAVGILTERATDSGQLSEDWSLILEICDAINESDDGPKEAIRAIRKRINSSAGRDHVIIWFTLLLLEACIKNCGKRFYNQIANKEFLHDFLKILAPKNAPPEKLQQKVLSMLKFWVDCNWDVPGRKDLEKVYSTLRQKGVCFPDNTNEKNIERDKVQHTCLATAPLSPKSSFDVRPQQGLPDTAANPDIATGTGVRRKCCSVLPSTASNHEHPTTSNTGLVLAHSDNNSNDNNGIGPATLPTRSALDAVSMQHSTVVVPCRIKHPAHCGSPDHYARTLVSRPQQVYHVQGHQLQQQERRPNRSMATKSATALSPTVGCSMQCADGSSHVVLFNPDCRLASTNHVVLRRSLPPTVSADHMVFDVDGTIRRLTSAQRSKLAHDLSVVETNVNVLNDMLAELKPDHTKVEDLHLLQELHQTCRAMHLRVIEFLSQVSDEEVTPSLLQVNENLQSALLRYKRFENRRLPRSPTRAIDSPPQLALPASGNGDLSVRQAITAGSPQPLAITCGQYRDSGNNCRDDHDDDDDDDSLIDISSPSLRTPESTDPQNSEPVTSLGQLELVLASRGSQSAHNLRDSCNCPSHLERSMAPIVPCTCETETMGSLTIDPSSSNVSGCNRGRLSVHNRQGDSQSRSVGDHRQQQHQHLVAPSNQQRRHPTAGDLVFF